MHAPTAHQLHANLDRVIHHAKHLRQLDFYAETDREQALTESLRLLGALTRYRHLLQQMDDCTGIEHRRAA